MREPRRGPLECRAHPRWTISASCRSPDEARYTLLNPRSTLEAGSSGGAGCWIIALGARVHLFVRPQAHDAFVALFRDVLGCDIRELDFGLEYPILFVPFDDGSGFSVEFSERAPAEVTDRPLDDDTAFRGAWIEFRTAALDRLQTALRAAGIPEFRHSGSSQVYFCAPGGQVFRLLDVGYTGP